MNNQDKTPEGLTPNLPLWSYHLQQNSKLAVKTRKDLEIYLITRALKDEDFREELIANPKAVVEKELGTKLPEELEIKVLEETEDTLYMVLPCNPYEGISEDDLKALVGMTYEDVAQWVLEQQRNTFLDEASSVKIISQAWRDELFKHKLLHQAMKVIKQELGPKKSYEDIQGIQFQVLMETSNSLLIVLPRFVMPPDSLQYGEFLAYFNKPMIIGGGSGVGSQQCISIINCGSSCK
jgi:hypothetical protein